MKISLKTGILLPIIFSGITAVAQSIKGTVISEGSPVSSVSVQLKPGGKGAFTDNDGRYQIPVSPGSYTITFSFTGLQQVTEDVTVGAGEEKTIDVVLVVQRSMLDEVVLTGSRAFPRSSANTPLPVDNFDYKTLQTTGQTSFDKAMQYRVPSLIPSIRR